MKWRVLDPEVDHRTWTEIVLKYCQACRLNSEDAIDRSIWAKLIMIGVSESMFLLVILAHSDNPG